jgi:hypothetical protein
LELRSYAGTSGDQGRGAKKAAETLSYCNIAR